MDANAGSLSIDKICKAVIPINSKVPSNPGVVGIMVPMPTTIIVKAAPKIETLTPQELATARKKKLSANHISRDKTKTLKTIEGFFNTDSPLMNLLKIKQINLFTFVGTKAKFLIIFRVFFCSVITTGSTIMHNMTIDNKTPKDFNKNFGMVRGTKNIIAKKKNMKVVMSKTLSIMMAAKILLRGIPICLPVIFARTTSPSLRGSTLLIRNPMTVYGKFARSLVFFMGRIIKQNLTLRRT